MIIGDKGIFAFVIGQKEDDTMQVVDIWMNNELITYFDNTVYLPQFINSLVKEVDNLEKNKIQVDYVFLNYGPTTDDISSRIKLVDDHIKIFVSYNDGKQFNIQIELMELIKIYKETIGILTK